MRLVFASATFMVLFAGGGSLTALDKKAPDLAPKVGDDAGDGIFIIMYKKEIFTNGKTKDGETLEQLCKRHAKAFKGQVSRILEIIDGCTMHLSPDNAAKLAKLPEVKAVEKNRKIKLQ